MKLTKDLKDKITAAILDHRFAAERKKLKEDREALAVAVYSAKYSKADRDLMAKLPAGWLMMRSNFFADINGNFTQLDLPSPFPFGYGHRSNGACLIVIGPGDKLSERYEAVAERRALMDDAAKEAKIDIEGIIDSVTTVAKLRDRWPEAVKIIDAVVDKLPKPAATLPATPMPELNQRLCLPPKQVKQ